MGGLVLEAEATEGLDALQRSRAVDLEVGGGAEALDGAGSRPDSKGPGNVGKGPGKRPGNAGKWPGNTGKNPGNVGTRPGVKLPNFPKGKSTVYPKRPGIPGFPGKQSPSISGDRLRGLSTIKNRTIKGLGQSSNLKVNRTIPLQRIQPLGGLGL
ncbi:MAG: hypothetical protein EBZ24_12065 [Synechococcaceae bacterium WB9_4xB_025]|nr:hypothetical protein [Synechococcaceae bacterium WB9_4xB_025]